MFNFRHFGLPADLSTHGASIDQLIVVMHIFMIALFLGWAAFLVYTLVRFRQRKNHTAHYHVKHFKVPTYLEFGVAIFEFILLAAFATPVWLSVKKVQPQMDHAVEIRVVAQQFAWNIHYPGKDNIFGKTDPKLMDSSNPLGLEASDPFGKDDVTTLNQLHTPVHTPILVRLTSKDVIHCFDLLVMRVKQDVIPGMSIPVWFEAKEEGESEIACAQLCGFGHYRMRGFLTVESKEKFNAWLAEQATSSEATS